MAEVYRIREARVEVCNGRRCWHERRFIAERRITLLGLFSWWWPVRDSMWHAVPEQARLDAERDAMLRAPLSAAVVLEREQGGG